MMPPGRNLNPMYLHYRSAFDFFIGVDPMRFLSAVNPNDPEFLNVQRLLGPVAEWGPRTIPLLIHADGAVFTKKSQRSIAIPVMPETNATSARITPSVPTLNSIATVATSGT